MLGATTTPSPISQAITMYSGVLTGKDTDSGDQILVASGLIGTIGLFVLPSPWNFVPAVAAIAVYAMASQA
jgi:hypothetical protein